MIFQTLLDVDLKVNQLTMGPEESCLSMVFKHGLNMEQLQKKVNQCKEAKKPTGGYFLSTLQNSH